jgi:hypothetical protein
MRRRDRDEGPRIDIPCLEATDNIMRITLKHIPTTDKNGFTFINRSVIERVEKSERFNTESAHATFLPKHYGVVGIIWHFISDPKTLFLLN